MIFFIVLRIMLICVVMLSCKIGTVHTETTKTAVTLTPLFKAIQFLKPINNKVAIGGLVIDNVASSATSTTASFFDNATTIRCNKFEEGTNIELMLVFSKPLVFPISPSQNIMLQTATITLNASATTLSAPIDLLGMNATLTYDLSTDTCSMTPVNKIKCTELLPDLVNTKLKESLFESIAITIKQPFTNPIVAFNTMIDFGQFSSITGVSLKKSIVPLNGGYNQQYGLILTNKNLNETSSLIPTLLSALTCTEVTIQVKTATNISILGKLAIDFPGIADVLTCNVVGNLSGEMIPFFEGRISLTMDILGIKFNKFSLKILPSNLSVIQLVATKDIIPGDVQSVTMLQLTPTVDIMSNPMKPKINLALIIQEDISSKTADWFMNFGNDIASFATATAHDIAAIFTTNIVANKMQETGSAIKNSFTTVGGNIGSGMQNVGNSIANGANDGLNKVADGTKKMKFW